MPFDIRFIDNPTKRIQEVAIRLDPFVIEYIPMIDKIYSKSNKYIYKRIKYIQNPTSIFKILLSYEVYKSINEIRVSKNLCRFGRLYLLILAGLYQINIYVYIN